MNQVCSRCDKEVKEMIKLNCRHGLCVECSAQTLITTFDRDLMVNEIVCEKCHEKTVLLRPAIIKISRIMPQIQLKKTLAQINQSKILENTNKIGELQAKINLLQNQLKEKNLQLQSALTRIKEQGEVIKIIQEEMKRKTLMADETIGQLNAKLNRALLEIGQKEQMIEAIQKKMIFSSISLIQRLSNESNRSSSLSMLKQLGWDQQNGETSYSSSIQNECLVCASAKKKLEAFILQKILPYEYSQDEQLSHYSKEESQVQDNSTFLYHPNQSIKSEPSQISIGP